MYEQGLINMARLNRNGAALMMKHGATASTDVTGFGILGHAQNLASIQKENIDFILTSLPFYKGLKDLDGIVADFELKKGFAPETSGG